RDRVPTRGGRPREQGHRARRGARRGGDPGGVRQQLDEQDVARGDVRPGQGDRERRPGVAGQAVDNVVVDERDSHEASSQEVRAMRVPSGRPAVDTGSITIAFPRMAVEPVVPRARSDVPAPIAARAADADAAVRTPRPVEVESEIAVAGCVCEVAAAPSVVRAAAALVAPRSSRPVAPESEMSAATSVTFPVFPATELTAVPPSPSRIACRPEIVEIACVPVWFARLRSAAEFCDAALLTRVSTCPLV